MRIDFPGRKIVVGQVQRALGLKDDGDDRRLTWQAIVNALPLVPVPIIVQSSSVQFPDRDNITMRVQRFLGAYVDGHDGQETWSFLAQRFDPTLKESPVKPISQTPSLPIGEYPERIVSSPNRNNGVNECKGCVIHHASGYYEGTVSWCLQKGTNASYHILVNTDGRRTVMGPDTTRLHHAGQSVWKGRSGCNAFMLGLAFIGNTNDGTMRGDAGPRLTPDEIASAVQWLRPRMRKYGWTKDDITAHRIIAPGRKDDTSLHALNQILSAI